MGDRFMTKSRWVCNIYGDLVNLDHCLTIDRCKIKSGEYVVRCFCSDGEYQTLCRTDNKNQMEEYFLLLWHRLSGIKGLEPVE